jgi:hypothetical protein
VAGKNIHFILPVWHGITKANLAKFYPQEPGILLAFKENIAYLSPLFFDDNLTGYSIDYFPYH